MTVKMAKRALAGAASGNGRLMTTRRRFLTGAGAAAGLLLAGCASADKDQANSTQTTATQANGMSDTSGMSMDMGSVASQVPEVNGVKPVPIRTLASSYWQGMEIQAQTTTPVPFWVDNGTAPGAQTLELSEHKPPPDASFHLMVMLMDRYTKVPIPYAGVWVTIFDSAGRQLPTGGRQWPMISAYMGPHYGNNVSLPGPGDYTLKLLISPPASARHIEYKDVWLEPHTLTQHFTWKPTD